MTELDIACRRASDGEAWICDVAVDVEGGTSTRHVVTVASADLARLDPGAGDPHLLVDRSFRFLLEREPNTSILRSFDLMEIARYFPEFESTIREFDELDHDDPAGRRQSAERQRPEDLVGVQRVVGPPGRSDRVQRTSIRPRVGEHDHHPIDLAVASLQRHPTLERLGVAEPSLCFDPNRFATVADRRVPCPLVADAGQRDLRSNAKAGSDARDEAPEQRDVARIA